MLAIIASLAAVAAPVQEEGDLETSEFVICEDIGNIENEVVIFEDLEQIEEPSFLLEEEETSPAADEIAADES